MSSRSNIFLAYILMVGFVYCGGGSESSWIELNQANTLDPNGPGTPEPEPKIYLFGVEDQNGNMKDIDDNGTIDYPNAREGADAVCELNLPEELSDLNLTVHAALNIETGDYLENMVENYGVPEDLKIKTVSDDLIAYTWSEFTLGFWQGTIAQFNVLSAGHFWLGSDTENCSGFDSALLSDSGAAGDSTDIYAMTGSGQDSLPCPQKHGLLCVAY